MRIVLDTRYVNDRFPGIGRYAFNLARALAELDEDDELLLLHNPALADSRHDLKQLDRPPRCRLVPCPVPRFLPAELVALPHRVRGLRPDLFHSPFYLGPVRPGCPAVATVFDLTPLLPGMSPVDRAVFRLALRRAAGAAAAVVTGSHAAALALRRRYPDIGPRLHVTPLAVEASFRPPSVDAAAVVLQRLSLPRRYVLHLGSHLPHKRVDLLLRAWECLCGPDGRSNEIPTLVLAGPAGPETRRLRATVGELGMEGSVRFLGAVPEPDLPAVVGGAELFVLPSDTEGFGLPVLEAMACGTPVVASAIDALAEVADDAAVFFAPGNTADLASTVKRLLDDAEARRRLSSRGLARARLFSWEATARATRRAYAEAAGG